jgi:hypothetical protein
MFWKKGKALESEEGKAMKVLGAVIVHRGKKFGEVLRT